MQPFNATNYTTINEWLTSLRDTLGIFTMPFLILMGYIIMVSGLRDDKFFFTWIYLAISGFIAFVLFDSLIGGALTIFLGIITGVIMYLGFHKRGPLL